jgi:hypothetical protein
MNRQENTMNPRSDTQNAAEPWWRVGPMWLVVGGPLLVVVAAIATAVIAVNGADPVLDKRAYQATLQPARQLQGTEREAALIKLQPAHQARNHAASPVVKQAP